MSGPATHPEPVEIRHERKARRMVVLWTDRHESVFPLNYLRSRLLRRLRRHNP